MQTQTKNRLLLIGNSDKKVKGKGGFTKEPLVPLKN